MAPLVLLAAEVVDDTTLKDSSLAAAVPVIYALVGDETLIVGTVASERNLPFFLFNEFSRGVAFALE